MNQHLRRILAFLTVLAAFAMSALITTPAQADDDRFSAGGYFRIGARPDFQGGYSKLGLWNISGRLLNESQWAALEMRLQLIKQTPGTNEVWTSLHAKIEGGSAHAADILNGSLGNFALTQLYVKAGNILIEDLVWQLGTLDFYFGDLGLYDMKFAEIFYDTVGLSGTWSSDKVDVLVGIGDSGYLKNPNGYAPVLTLGAATRVRPKDGIEFGVGAELMFEPSVTGNKNAPHQTNFGTVAPSVNYQTFARHEVLQTYAETLASQELFELNYPTPSDTDAFGFKIVGYLGFGKLGALKWNNLFFNFLRQLPEQYYTENYKGIEKRIYVKEWTDERYQFNLGDEMNLEIVRDRFDLTWAAMFGYHFDKDDDITASERNRMIWSIVARGQVYITPVVHFIAETSFAQEKSLNGNLWNSNASRNTVNNGIGCSATNPAMCNEYGDLDTRNTWQGKLGFILSPGGAGIFARPSLRLLYGVQYSNMHNAFETANTDDYTGNNEFFKTDLSKIPDRNWHHVLSIEAEAWF